ncbi:hypothetical protein BDB01DRAFT_851753 [Pilobolus umbonatus]|nr:hypothetical protein BDB01DRAFT_851753 [Pilobolus umbonatus]
MQQPLTYYPAGYPPTSPYPTPGTVASNSENINGTVANVGIKRKQVKNACTNCQKACKKCDDARPCPRCMKYGISDTCVNSVRKERQKGVKRGPYKRKDKTADGKPATAKKEETTNQINYNPAANIRTQPAANNPFGYPTQLTQYNPQQYDSYHGYPATYNKDQIISNAFVMNPAYGPYPVMVAAPDASNPGNTSAPSTAGNVPSAAGNESGNNNNHSNQHVNFAHLTQQFTNNHMANFATYSHPGGTNLIPGQHIPGIVYAPPHSIPSSQSVNATSTQSAVISSNNSSSVITTMPTVMPKPPNTTANTNHASNTEDGSVILVESSLENKVKNQPMTPVPSTSNSSNTSSPADSHGEDDHSKFGGLSQLCSAALRDTNKSNEADSISCVKKDN